MCNIIKTSKKPTNGVTEKVICEIKKLNQKDVEIYQPVLGA